MCLLLTLERVCGKENAGKVGVCALCVLCCLWAENCPSRVSAFCALRRPCPEMLGAPPHAESLPHRLAHLATLAHVCYSKDETLGQPVSLCRNGTQTQRPMWTCARVQQQAPSTEVVRCTPVTLMVGSVKTQFSVKMPRSRLPET